jgi:hypothetical protein
VLAIHGLLGDPEGVLMPLIAELEPMLRRTADTLSQWGIERSAEEIGAATARVAWIPWPGRRRRQRWRKQSRVVYSSYSPIVKLRSCAFGSIRQ